MDYQTRVLWDIADGIGVLPLRRMALEPGVMAVYRVTVYHEARELCHSVATLRSTNNGETQVTLRYAGALVGKPLVHRVPQPRYHAFTAALQKARFDHLHDQPDIPPHGVDLWMVERAAGSFLKGIVVAPQQALGIHAAIVQAIQTHLPEALREVRRT